MAEIGDSSSPEFSLDVLSQEELTRKIQKMGKRQGRAIPQQEQAESQAQGEPIELAPKANPKKPLRSKRRSSAKTNQSKTRPVTRDPQTHAMEKKHEQERKMLLKNMNEMAKKKDRDIRELMDVALKNHYTHIEKERQDYLSLLGELKETILAQGKESLSGMQQMAVSVTESEVERMVNWFQDEFMKELTRKSQEYEELKALSEMKVNSMFEENQAKSREINSLDVRLRRIASALPANVRDEVFEELGLQHLIEERENQSHHEQRQKAGLFAKLKKMFSKKHHEKKSKPKIAKKPVRKTKRKEEEELEIIAT